MRLSCPNCDASYEVPDGMVPAAGRHVQCTACHTRWFVRGAAAPAPSEESILTRLETRARPAPVAPVILAPVAVAPVAAPVAAAPVVLPIRPAKPEEMPAAPPPDGGEPESLPVRAAPRRLDLTPPPVAAERPEQTQPGGSGRFGLGVACALGLFVLGLAAYDFRRDIEAGVPQAAPALAAYHAQIDDLRDWLEQRLAPLRAG